MMKPWNGGDKAPDDWKPGNRVRFRNGIEMAVKCEWFWGNKGESSNIVAYDPTWTPDERTVQHCAEFIESLPNLPYLGHVMAYEIRSQFAAPDPVEEMARELFAAGYPDVQFINSEPLMAIARHVLSRDK